MLTTTATQTKQAGNGATVAFNFAFRIVAQTDLVVTKFDAGGNQSAALILGTDYTVVFDAVAQTGTVTFTVAPVNGGAALIQRVSDNTQATSYPREGNMPAKATEYALDKLQAQLQELKALILISGTPPQIGVTAVLVAQAAANPTIPFLGIFTDSRTIQVYLGNTALGQSGWAPIGGF